MHVLDQRVLGVGILALLVMLVVVKRVRTGSVLDRPKGPLLVQLVNAFNLVFLLIVNPLAAVALILRRAETADPTRVVIGAPTHVFSRGELIVEHDKFLGRVGRGTFLRRNTFSL